MLNGVFVAEAIADTIGASAFEAVFDLQGRRIRTLLDETLPAGPYRIPWDRAMGSGPGAASGIYFLRLTHGGKAAVRQISVVK